MVNIASLKNIVKFRKPPKKPPVPKPSQVESVSELFGPQLFTKEDVTKTKKFTPVDPSQIQSRSARDTDYFMYGGKRYLKSEGEPKITDFASGSRQQWYPKSGAIVQPLETLKQDTFRYKGKTYPKSEGVAERYVSPTTGRPDIVWTPKTVKGQPRGQNPFSLKLQKERKMIVDEMKQMNPKVLHDMSGEELKIYMNNKFNIDRSADTISNMRREAGAGPGSGTKTDIPGVWANQHHLNTLSESGKETVRKFFKKITQEDKELSSAIGGNMVSSLNRMVYQARKQNAKKDVGSRLGDDALEARMMEKINEVDIKGYSKILKEKILLQRKVKQAREMGIELDDLNLSHMEDVALNWEKALEVENLFIAESKANKVIQKALNNRIKKIKADIKKAETFAEKRAIASEMKGIRQQLIDRGLVSKIEGTTYGKARTASDIERQLDNLINAKLSGTILNRGGLVRPNMAYGGDMAQFTEMESVVPDLNPAEAGMEDYTQLAMSIPKFRNPFKAKKPPEIISDVSDSLKITDKTKKGAKIEGTVKMEGQTPIFHLKSDLELTNAVQDKMTPQQWFGYLTKRGVSPTELHEFGLGNLLKNLGGWDEGTKKWKSNVPITKAELISQYKNNKPIISYKIQQMDPFEKGWSDFQNFLTGQRSGGRYVGDLPSSAREFEELRQLRNKPQDLTGDHLRSNIIKFMSEISERTGRDLKKSWPELEPQITSNINKIIKDAYGIENVVENGFGNAKVPFYTQNLVNRFRRLKKGEGFYMGKTGVGHEGAQFLEGGTGYIEIPFTYNPNPKGMRANEPRFKFGEGHFTNPKGNNPVFWLRASERVDERGKRVFLIEEIQSDMHQKVKQKPDTFKYAQRQDDPEFIKTTYSLSQVKKLKDDLGRISDQIDKVTGHTDPSAVTIMERLKVKREALRNQIREAEDLISQAAGKSDEIFPEGPWKKSENQVKVSVKTLINLATQEGFDSVAMISGKAKNHAVGADTAIAKGNRGFYDNIAVSGMKSVAKNLGLEFSSTNIKDGKGNTWAKIPIINLKKEPVKASVDMYKAEGGYIHRPSFVDVVPTL